MSLEFVRNFNKRGGRFFFVIYRDEEWIGKIFFKRKLDLWCVEFENKVMLSERERGSVFKFKDKLENMREGE